MLHAELEVFFIFFGEGGDADGDAGEVDALVLAEHAAVDDFALDLFAGDLENAELDEAVGEENARAGLEVFGEGGEGGGDDGGGAEDVTGSDGEALAGLELNGDAIFEAAGADLGTLEIAEDADIFVFFAGDLADHFDELEFFGEGAVGEIEAGDIEAGAEQLTEDGFAGGSRPQRGDNFGAAEAVACEAGP